MIPRVKAVVLLLVLLVPAIAVPSTLFRSSSASAQAPVAYSAPHVHWQTLGPHFFRLPNGSASSGLFAAGRIAALAPYYPDPSIMYSGGSGTSPYSQAGVYFTQDNGTTWRQVDGNMTSTDVNAVWVSQVDPKVVLAGTDSAIYRSSNGGASWSAVYSSRTYALLQVGDIIYAGTDSGVVESNDLGHTWNVTIRTSYSPTALGGASGYVYAGTQSGEIVSRSAPSSQWTTVRQSDGFGITSLGVNSTNPHVVFATVCCPRGMWATYDGGKTWDSITLPPQYNNDFAYFSVSLDALNPLVFYVSGCCQIFNSSDGGSTFKETNAGLDTWTLMPYQGRAGTLFALSDQGLYLVSHGGAKWASLNGNLSTSILYSVSVNSRSIFAGMQDNEPFASFDGGATWQQQLNSAAGEGGPVKINPYNPSDIYIATAAGRLTYSTDGGRDYSNEFSIIPYGVSQGLPGLIAFDQKDPGAVYVAASNGVFIGSGNGATWTKLPWPFTKPTLIVIDTQDDKTIYVGNKTSSTPYLSWDQSGNLFVSHDGGVSWTECDLGGALGFPTAVAVDPLNSSIVLAAVSRGPQASGGILLSNDAGRTFRFSNQGLNNLPEALDSLGSFPSIWSLSFRPDSSLVAAATENGIYVSTDLGRTWKDVTGNSVTRAFTDTAWSGDALYTSTFGEGVLSTYLPNDSIYSLRFSSAGLPPGLTWSVTVDGTTLASTTNSLDFFVNQGTHFYSITSPTGYTTSNQSSSVTMSSDIGITIAFTPVVSTTTSSSATSRSTTSTATPATITTTSSTSTTSATTTSSTTSSSTSSSSSTPSTSSSGGGGIPEFPYQFLTVGVLTVIIVASYLLARRRAVPRGPFAPPIS